MKPPETQDMSLLIRAWNEGDRSALDRLAPTVYGELRRIARHYMRGQRPGQTLQTTALVHEAYLRLVDSKSVQLQDRAHFFAMAAQIMRRVLVDAARARASQKRGGGRECRPPAPAVNLDDLPAAQPDRSAEFVLLDDALRRLESFDERKARVVELRFFGGLDVEEVAEILAVSPQTVMRDWRLARVWLARELGVTPEPRQDSRGS